MASAWECPFGSLSYLEVELESVSITMVATVPCFCAFYIFNTTPNPASSQNVFVLVYCIFLKARVHVCVNVYMYVSLCVCL